LIGVGVHGRVYRAVHRASQQTVALKKVNMGDNVSGIPIAALREIAVLREMQAPCVIRFIDGTMNCSMILGTSLYQ
jgi:serine/threonine protein kinase